VIPTTRTDRDTLDRVRRSLWVLAGVLVVGIVAELCTTRHWHGPQQLVAWASVAATALAAVLVAGAGGSGRKVGRGLLVVVAAAAAFGVWSHVVANLDSGPLDFRYATTWEGLSATRRWWLALSGGVGASPPLVPLVLVLTVAVVLIADLCRRPREGALSGD
jgi:hypothetical protein